MMLIAETRPSRRGGVTDWRSVVVLITQRIGPTPSRKKLSAASSGERRESAHRPAALSRREIAIR